MSASGIIFSKSVKQIWLRSPLPLFLHWWGGELASLLPSKLREFLLRRPLSFLISMEPKGLVVQSATTRRMAIPALLPLEAQRRAFSQILAKVTRDDQQIVLVVPPNLVLTRRLVMPEAVMADPYNAVGYELDRQTPFKSEQLYYAVKVLKPSQVPVGRVALELYALPKAEVEPILGHLHSLGVCLDAMDAKQEDGLLANINLLPKERRSKRTNTQKRINRALAVVVAALVVLLLSQWLSSRHTQLVRMRSQVSELKVHAQHSEKLRTQLTGALAAGRLLDKRMASSPPPLQVLGALTKSLPSSAWLDTLNMDDAGNLDIRGEASHAATLVGRLSRVKILQNPKLEGVIHPDPATGKERFEITAHIADGGNHEQ